MRAKTFLRSDVITTAINPGTQGVAYFRLEHIPSGISVAGPCHTFTKKDEYRLLNALADLVNEVWSDAEHSYCDECHRISRT